MVGPSCLRVYGTTLFDDRLIWMSEFYDSVASYVSISAPTEIHK